MSAQTAADEAAASPAQTIEALDAQIDANRAALIAHLPTEPTSAADWQDAWDAHPDLQARDRDLFRQRGIAQLARGPQAEEVGPLEAPAVTDGDGYTVHYQSNIWDGRPMADPCTCRHPGPMAFPIGITIERVRGRNAIRVDASICMDCGSDSTGKVDLVEGLTMAYHEATNRLAVPFLWRTCDLVEHRRAELLGRPIPLWMARPLGMTTDDINAARQAARVHYAAQYMAARVARYAKAA